MGSEFRFMRVFVQKKEQRAETPFIVREYILMKIYDGNKPIQKARQQKGPGRTERAGNDKKGHRPWGTPLFWPSPV
jgi:hypothetical protein